MIVVGHEAVRMADPVEAFRNVCQHVDKRLAIRIVLEDRLAPITAGGDVIEGSGKFDV
jgi:hypothetical protein